MLEGKSHPAQVLMVLTSHDRLGDSGSKTGFWLEEFCAAYYVFKDAGADVTLASPMGGQPPIDPRSDRTGDDAETVRRFKSDHAARTVLADTLSLEQVAPEDFDAVFYVGGHGAMWDLAEDHISQAVIAAAHGAGKPVALVGHGPAALRGAVDAKGRPLVEGRRITATSNSEEEAMGFVKFLPFLLQNELVKLGGLYSKGPDRVSYVVRDGPLITGQNTSSAADAARTLLDTLDRYECGS
jgi:putative intracellular protease/amidase